METKLVQTALGELRVYSAGTITRALENGQWWDHHLKTILDDAYPGVAIDIGAHFGWFTLYLAQHHDRVIAVEPYPPSFALLQWNVQGRPGLEHRIQCWPLAAYDRVATLEFAPGNDVTDAGSFGFTPFSAVRPGWEPVRIAGMPLDPYLQDTPVTLIKCDAQGADLRALKGLEQTIRRNRPLIVFEWEEGMAAWQGDTWRGYEEFFAALDYSVERITTDYWDFCARPL